MKRKKRNRFRQVTLPRLSRGWVTLLYHHLTLKGPEGNVVRVKVMDPKNLEKVKVGDKLFITYTEALAISVERAGN